MHAASGLVSSSMEVLHLHVVGWHLNRCTYTSASIALSYFLPCKQAYRAAEAASGAKRLVYAYRVLRPLLPLLLCVAILLLSLQQQCCCFLLLYVIVCRKTNFGAGSLKMIPVLPLLIKRDFILFYPLVVLCRIYGLDPR